MKKRIISLVLVLSVIASLMFAVPVTANAYNNWSDAYKYFVLNQKYLSFGQYYENDGVPYDYCVSTFSLNDFEQDNIPELIIYDNSTDMAGSVWHVYKFDSEIKYIGDIGFRTSYFYRVENYPGLFFQCGKEGYFPGYYYSIEDGKIKDEHILTNKEEFNGEYFDYPVIKETENIDLFNKCVKLSGFNNNDPSEYRLPEFSLSEINSMGWDTFLEYYGYKMSTSDNSWETLYLEKMLEIKNEYQTGLRKFKYDGYEDENNLFFTLQDIDFDGVPELYHTQCSRFEGEYGTSQEDEEIYYIKNGKVEKARIESDYELGLLPSYSKKPVGDFYVDRYQYVAQNTATGEISFITNDSCNYGAVDYPSRTYLRLEFDKNNGVLRSTLLLRQDAGSYETEQYLEGYKFIGVGTYFSNTFYDRVGNLWEWSAPYIKPSIKVTLNGEELSFPQPPVIVNDRTLVPVREIFEALGASVDWNGATQEVTATKDSKKVKLRIGSNTMIIENGQTYAEKELDVPAQLINDKTMVPVRAISEAFDCHVDWDEEKQTVKIS